MGMLKSDGKATNVVAPSGVWNFGELARIGSWNGIVMKDVAAADTARGMALEISERIWYVTIPNIAATKGLLLHWTTGGSEAAGYRGQTALQIAANGPACCIVEEGKDANHVAGIRVLNLGPPAA